MGAPSESQWLFPGIQPDSPLRASRLQVRLNAYGLRARAARTTALLDLATEVPPVVLADLLGMYPTLPSAASGPITPGPPSGPARPDSASPR